MGSSRYRTALCPALPPRLRHHVINRCLHFLDAWDVVARDDNRQIDQTAADDLPSVVAEQRERQHPALARLVKRGDDVRRSSARRDGDVAAAAVGDELAKE